MKEGIILEKQESLIYIEQLLEKQRKLDDLNRAVKDTTVSLDKAQRALETYKVRITEEAAQIVKKQREQLENRLEKEVQSAVRRVEQAEKKRSQEKERQKKSHIADATQEYRERIRQAWAQIKADMKADKVPAFCGSRLWFSLFMPVFLTDYILLILVWLIEGLGIPALIYWLIPDHNIWQFYIIFPLCLVLIIMLYIEVHRRTVGRHKETLKLCREKMNLIHELKGRIRKTEKTITKSDDESPYELRELDEKIQKARLELDTARKNQADGLREFEQHLRLDIIEEFREKSQPKLDELTGAIGHLSREKNLFMETASELQLEMVDDYEDILGAENLNAARLEQILNCLEEGGADSLEQALKILGFASGRLEEEPMDMELPSKESRGEAEQPEEDQSSTDSADTSQGQKEKEQGQMDEDKSWTEDQMDEDQSWTDDQTDEDQDQN